MKLIEIIDKVTPLVFDNPKVHAMWIEGSYATGKNHDSSDIDLWFDVDDGTFKYCYDDFLNKLSRFAEVKEVISRGIYSIRPKLEKKTYILNGLPIGQNIELDMQEHSRKFIFSRDDHVIKVLFDKDNTIKWQD